MLYIKIIIFLITVFIVLFLLVFQMICKGEKEEIKENKMKIFSAFGAAIILALAPTVVLGFILFLLFGSTSFLNEMFSLHISKSQLAFIAIAFLIYFFTIDSIIEFIISYILGKHMFNLFLLLFLRILFLYPICLFFHLEQFSSLIIAFVISLITFLIEIVNFFKNK